MSAPHLVRRFFGALWPSAPSPADDAWAAQVSLPEELLLYRRLPNHDRRHAIRVGRRAERELGPESESRWIAAALLHDVGKYDADLSVPGRALATLAAAGSSGSRRMARWQDAKGFRGRAVLYSVHGELGAVEIRRAGGRDEAAVWSAAHHHPDAWPGLAIPQAVIVALDRADQT
jgi:hypothetical protein